MANTITNGDIVRVDLVGRVNSHEGPVFQVTNEAVAREEGMLEDDKHHHHYEPKLVVVGKGQVIDGLDEALVGMAVGEEKKLMLPPEKAFGKADPKKRLTMSFREFKQKFKKPPRVGDPVEMPQSHEQGRISRILQGKVIIDTNHVLADRDVYYTIKVVEKLEGEDAHLKAMIEQRMPGIPASEFQLKQDGTTLEITVPSQAIFYQQFGFSAYLLAMEIQKEQAGIETVKMVLEFKKPKQPEATALADATADDASVDGETATGDEPAKKPRKTAKKASKKADASSEATETPASDGE